MSCACYTAIFTRDPAGQTFSSVFSRTEGAPFYAEFIRTCAIVSDLVAFSAADGMFLTKEGYTILVKI